MSSLAMVLAPFIMNGLMEVFKILGAEDWKTSGKRTLLAALAILGVVAGNYLNGTPLDTNSIQNLTQIAVESLIAFFATHGTYTMFWNR